MASSTPPDTIISPAIDIICKNDEDFDDDDEKCDDEEECDEFHEDFIDPCERNYHTITGSTNTNNNRNINPSIRFPGSIYYPQKSSTLAITNRSTWRSNMESTSPGTSMSSKIPIVCNHDKKQQQQHTNNKKKRSSTLNKTLMLFRPPSHPLLSRSNSTPVKHKQQQQQQQSSMNMKQKSKPKQQSTLSTATALLRPPSPLTLSLNTQQQQQPLSSSPNVSRSPSPSKFSFNSPDFYCHYCGAGSSPPTPTMFQQQQNINIDDQQTSSSPPPPSSRSPNRKLFNRSMSTDCPSTSSSKQSWNRRSMRYCRSKSKHLYHMVVCRFLVVGGY